MQIFILHKLVDMPSFYLLMCGYCSYQPTQEVNEMPISIHEKISVLDETNRRVIACWNACIGIPTETLEATDPNDQPALVVAMARQIVQLRGELKIALNREAP